MKLFPTTVLLLLALLATAQAQQQADEKYIGIYNLIQEADTLVSAGHPNDALAVFETAQEQLQRLQKQFPSWSPNVVNYRLTDLTQKITAIKRPVPAPKVTAPTADKPSENAAKPSTPTETLQSQLQAAQEVIANLQARLKEALTAQPAVVDATEFTRAQEQIRWLMKENELLKVTRAPAQKVVGADTNAPAKVRQELAVATKKYSAEQALAARLAAENEKLRASLAAAAATNTEALAGLNRENAKLKALNTTLQVAPKKAPAQSPSPAELTDARSQIATLKAAAATSALEKDALEKKLRKQADEFESQRKEFHQQLAAANMKKPAPNISATTAQLTALTEEAKILRSRVSVAESKPVPYTAQELAMFKQDAPATANPETIQRPIQQLPAGSADLVASAQRHFAKHEFDQAQADYLKILNRDQNNGLVLANLATIELQQGKLADAEKHILAAIAQNPDDPYNLSTLGYLKFRQEKYDDACNVLSRAAGIDAHNPEIQNYLGVTLSHKGLRPQAEAALRRAIQLAPNYAPAHNNLAVIYLSQENPVPALARWHYQKAVDSGQPRNPELEKMLADKGAPVAAP